MPTCCGQGGSVKLFVSDFHAVISDKSKPRIVKRAHVQPVARQMLDREWAKAVGEQNM